MNYPIQSLAIIAPITLLVLLIIIPIIGVFAGWKRAAYWGGGTFFFFLVGSLVYRFAGSSIFTALKPLLKSLVEKTGTEVEITDSLLQAICAPVFFLAVMIVGELLLLINYYAWFKRVAKIKRDIKLRKEMKAAKKEGKKLPKIEQKGWAQAQFTTKGKVVNKVCGGIGLGLLMVPSSITFTQAIYYTTTSPTTRSKNELNTKVFNTLENISSTFSWMGYYGKKTTGDAFSSLFSTLELTQNKITTLDEDGNVVEGYYVYSYNSETGEITKSDIKTGSTLNAVVDVVQTGFNNVFKQATTTTDEPDAQTENVVNTINAFSKGWNAVMQSASLQISSVFGSTEVTSLFKGIIGSTSGGSSLTISDETYGKNFGDNSSFEKLFNAYDSGTITIGEKEVAINKLETIPVNQATFDNLTESIKGLVNTSGLTTEHAADFENKLSSIASMLFQVQ